MDGQIQYAAHISSDSEQTVEEHLRNTAEIAPYFLRKMAGSCFLSHGRSANRRRSSTRSSVKSCNGARLPTRMLFCCPGLSAAISTVILCLCGGADVCTYNL